MSEKASTSTLLNHVVPPFYACYLLNSRATANSNRTYVGSTPNPPRRIRQHNGELTQGAWKTSRFRPWEMLMIVYGFPSKLTALQFEWAWQKPELSRHLRQEDVALFKKDAKRNWVERKILVARTLLSVTPFSRWPLHIRFFNEKSQRIFEGMSVQINPDITRILDLGGVAGSTGLREPNTPGVTAIDGPIDVGDTEFRQHAWSQWEAHQGRDDCTICQKHVHTEVHEAFFLCSDCGATTHIPCLSSHFLRNDNSILPSDGSCPSCDAKIAWGEVMRASFGRKELARRQREKPKRTRRKAKASAATSSGFQSEDLSSSMGSLSIGDRLDIISHQDRDIQSVDDNSDEELEWEKFDREMLSLR